jgi:hypothetical protein
VDGWGIARLVTLGAGRRMQPAQLKFCLFVEELPAGVSSVGAMSGVSVLSHRSFILRLFKATLHEQGVNNLLTIDMDYFESA